MISADHVIIIGLSSAWMCRWSYLSSHILKLLNNRLRIVCVSVRRPHIDIGDNI